MDKTKKVYIDSLYKTSDSISNANFKVEIKEALDSPSNTVCYIGGIPIPQSWYSIEDLNNKLYTKRVYVDTQTTGTIFLQYQLAITILQGWLLLYRIYYERDMMEI